MTPTRLGRYEIVDEIGKGAMGVVYLARDPLIGRLVALKTFRIGYSVKDQEMEQFRIRFMREAQSAGILTHPNIVTIHDVVEESGDGIAFIAMEYVRGTNLKLLLQGEQPLSLSFVLDITAQVGDALDYAHSNRVVHRDVKPANILITADNRVKITDFGIARLDSSNLTQEGQLLGTPNYMAPEQIQGKEVDHRADLFSLGVVVYEMLTRHKPFQGENLTVVSHRIVYDHFTPPQDYVKELPPGIEKILARALEKDPARRYQRAREMADEMRRVVDSTVSRDPLSETQSLSSTMVLPPAPPPLPPLAATKASRFSGWWSRSPAPPRPPLPLPPVPGTDGSSVSTPPPVPVAALPPLPPPQVDPLEDTLATAATAAPAPAPRRPIALGPLLAGVGAAALAVLLLYAGVLLWRGWSSQPAAAPPPPGEAEAQQKQARIMTFVNQGFAAMRKGQYEQAVGEFQKAEQIDPSRGDVRRLREAAQWQAQEFKSLVTQEQEIAANVAKAKEALAARNYDQAVALATLALAIDNDNEDVKAILAQAKEGQARRARQRAGLAQTGTPRPGEEAATATPATAETQPAARTSEAAPVEAANGVVRVHFTSDIPQGVLIVWVNGTERLRDNFGSKGSIFRRKPEERHEFNKTIEVPASGSVKFRVHIAPPGRPAIVKNLDGNFQGGMTRTLEIHLTESAQATASLN